MKYIVLALGFCGALAVSGAQKSSFDNCVDSLHKRGGLSIRDAQTECLLNPAPDVLACQNKQFLVNYLEPQKALQICKQDSNLRSESFQSNLGYHGGYEQVPVSSQKKTICSVTVNSEDERQLFRSELGSDKYNWVELLPGREDNRFIVRDNSWLQKACVAKIKCDILVLSGHFAESFIGDSGFEVAAQDLHDAACTTGCDDFFKSVKEVYLFGCNTLASKKQDARSVDQYVKILTEDGLGPHKAQRVAARRYTPYGVDYATEMKSIFSNATGIYGFPSVGPSGKSVARPLKNYLQAMRAGTDGDQFAIFSKYLGSLGMQKTTGLKSTMCESRNSVMQNMKSYHDVVEFVDRYAFSVPVAVVDLIIEANQQLNLNADQYLVLQQHLKAKWMLMDKSLVKSRLCPLALTENRSWLPANIDCVTQTSWLQAK